MKYRAGWMIAALLFATQAAQAEIAIGSSRDEVIQTLGQPKGVMNFGGREALTYDGGVVEIDQGKVVYMAPQFNEKMLRSQQAREYETAQRAKGLVLCEGQWMTPEEQQKIEAQKRRQKELEDAYRAKQEETAAKNRERVRAAIQVYAQGGQQIDLGGLMAQGKVTIIDFYADWCGPCKRLAPYLEQLVVQNTDVVLRKIDIVDWESPVARQYNLNSIPNVRVYNRNGKMVGQPTGDFKLITQYVREAY